MIYDTEEDPRVSTKKDQESTSWWPETCWLRTVSGSTVERVVPQEVPEVDAVLKYIENATEEPQDFSFPFSSGEQNAVPRARGHGQRQEMAADAPNKETACGSGFNKGAQARWCPLLGMFRHS